MVPEENLRKVLGYGSSGDGIINRPRTNKIYTDKNILDKSY